MAVIKIKAIKGSHRAALDYIMDEAKTVKNESGNQQVIDYITNAVKTNDRELVSGYNCTPTFSAAEFAMTQSLAKEVKGSYKNVGGSDVRAYHLIQSFSPEDALTPEEAHELGQQMMQQFLDGKHEFVIATHTDKAHIHNHIVFNATSFYDLKKFRSKPYLTVSQIRTINDKICAEHGLNVLAENQPLKSNYKQYQKYRSMTTYRVQIRKRINFLLETATDLSQFIEDANMLDVRIHMDGKHVTYQYGAQKRKTRDDKLSDDERFTKRGLTERLAFNKVLVDYLEKKIEDCFQQATSFPEFTQLLKQEKITFKTNSQGERSFLLSEFEDGKLSERAINEGYKVDYIQEYFSANQPLRRLEKIQTVKEIFDLLPQTMLSSNETAIRVSSKLVEERTKDGLLLNIVNSNGERGQLFIDANHVDFSSLDKSYHLYIGPQFNYYFIQDGKATNYFLKGEQLIRQLETIMKVPKISVEVPQSMIRSTNEKGLVLSFEKEGIQRLFIEKSDVTIDPLRQIITVELSNNWHYSYQHSSFTKKKAPYKVITGKQLVELIEKNQPMLDIELKYRLNLHQRKFAVAEAKELATQLNLLRNDRIKDVPELLQQIVSLEKQIQHTHYSLELLKEKISEYNQVAKYLLAYQNYSWVKEESSTKYKQEKNQFQAAVTYLDKKQINPMVSSEKVIALVKENQKQEVNLQNQLQHIGKKLHDYEKIYQLFDTLNEEQFTEPKKKNQKMKERE